MIRELQRNDINKVADIWLDTNIKAHDFIPAQYWKSNFKSVKEALLQAEVYVYEKEYVPEYDLGSNLPYTVEKTDAHVFTVEGPRIEKMLGYTNLDSEKGFTFFQRFLKETGILKELEDLGIEDGDTVRMYGHEFDYYK